MPGSTPTTFCIFHLQSQQQLSQDPTNRRTDVQKGKAMCQRLSNYQLPKPTFKPDQVREPKTLTEAVVTEQ